MEVVFFVFYELQGMMSPCLLSYAEVKGIASLAFFLTVKKYCHYCSIREAKERFEYELHRLLRK